MGEIRSAAAVFSTDADSRVRDWNRACERLTGIAASDAEGRHCWEVIAGRDDTGATVCHPGCSTARLAREGRPVGCTELQLRTPLGRRRVDVSIVVLRSNHDTTVLHLLREVDTAVRPPSPGPRPHLTRRQRQVLELLVDGIRVKEIAGRLTLSEATVRNHVRAILRELGAHSQLEAVARARALPLS